MQDWGNSHLLRWGVCECFHNAPVQPNLMAIHTNPYNLTRSNSYDLWKVVRILWGGNFVGIRMKDHNPPLKFTIAEIVQNHMCEVVWISHLINDIQIGREIALACQWWVDYLKIVVCYWFQITWQKKMVVSIVIHYITLHYIALLLDYFWPNSFITLI